MGSAVSDAGRSLADLEGQLIKHAAGGQEGQTLLAVLAKTNASLATVRDELDVTGKAAARVDVRLLPAGQQAAFAKARTRSARRPPG